MQSVLAFLTLAKFFLFFGSKLHFHEMRWNELTNKIEVNLNFLRSLNAAFAVSLMDKDFVDKLIQHGNGQIVEVFILLNQSNEPLHRLLVLVVGF